jgi:uncharacterized protein with von Willebrand factor type A (vWA) domain
MLEKLSIQFEPFLAEFREQLSVLLRALLTGDHDSVQKLLLVALQARGDGGGLGGRSQRIILQLRLAEALEEFELLRAAGHRRGLNPNLWERLSNYFDQQVRHLIRTIHQAVQAEAAETRPASTDKANRQPLEEKSFAYYSQEDIQRMREVVVRLALRFKTLLSIRQRKCARGRLDVKSTLRKNQRYGGVPFNIQLRRRTRQKPQVVVLCDISDSVMNASRFMLQFVYSVQELYSKVRSFVFVSDVGEATHLFSANPIDRAVEAALNGEVVDVFVHSNFGRSFKTFHDQYLSTVNKKTTVLILGDGRNNYHPANDWVLREIQERSKRLIWLNPESRLTWGLGDSEMPRYIPHCDVVAECRNIQQLAHILGRLIP